MIAQIVHRMRRLPSRAELMADDIIHIIGLSAGGAGAITAIVIAALGGRPIEIVGVSVYAVGLIAMLCCSAIYNMARSSPRRELLSRFDQAAIFLMIAGSYTPFTLVGLDGAWAFWLMATVWTGALFGAIAKFFRPRWFEPLTIPLYLALGWTVVVAIGPLAAALGTTTLILLAVGGVLYTVGVIFHVWERLPFQNAVWHAFVLAAAAVHYAAVMGGVVLRPL